MFAVCVEVKWNFWRYNARLLWKRLFLQPNQGCSTFSDFFAICTISLHGWGTYSGEFSPRFLSSSPFSFSFLPFHWKCRLPKLEVTFIFKKVSDSYYSSDIGGHSWCPHSPSIVGHDWGGVSPLSHRDWRLCVRHSSWNINSFWVVLNRIICVPLI